MSIEEKAFLNLDFEPGTDEGLIVQAVKKALQVMPPDVGIVLKKDPQADEIYNAFRDEFAKGRRGMSKTAVTLGGRLAEYANRVAVIVAAARIFDPRLSRNSVKYDYVTASDMRWAIQYVYLAYRGALYLAGVAVNATEFGEQCERVEEYVKATRREVKYSELVADHRGLGTETICSILKTLIKARKLARYPSRRSGKGRKGVVLCFPAFLPREMLARPDDELYNTDGLGGAVGDIPESGSRQSPARAAMLS